MSVTLVGAVLIPLGLYFALANPRRLYLIAVFFSPFTATAVLNVGSGTSASGVQVSLFLGFLLFVRFCIRVLSTGSAPFPRVGRAGLQCLSLFAAIVVLSLVMPVWINGHLQIPSPQLLDPSTQPLHLKSSNVTGALYVLIGVFFAYITVIWNGTAQMAVATLKAFLAGCSFSAFWGALEFGCKLSGIPYPAMIFNSSATGAAGGYKELLTGDVFRLSSVAVEPSVFAQVLLVAVSLYIPFVFGSGRLFGRRLDRVLFALIAVILLMTTSSTAYVGSILVVLVTLFLLAIRGALRLRHFFIPLAGVAMVALVYAAVPLARQVVESALLSKGGGYSALERLKTISDSYQMFLKYPVLGIGWASITSHDLIVNILANCGVLGLVAFTAAMYLIFRMLCRSVCSRGKTWRAVIQLDFAALVALAVTLITSIISGAFSCSPFFGGFADLLSPPYWRTCTTLGAIATATHDRANSRIQIVPIPVPTSL